MLFRVPRTAVILAVAGCLCLAADDTRPACDAENLGRLWPEAANHDPKVRKKMAKCGELQLCTKGIWRYHWESLTVRLDQLRGGSKLPKPAGCDVLPEVAIEPNGAGSNAAEPGTSRTH
jgi:hypothetical protein